MDAIVRRQVRHLVPALLHWFERNARDLPWRRTRDPYAIWVSEIMLQQTQVKTVIPYWERWLRELPNLEALARARPEKLHKLWEGLGYYVRVRHLHQAAQVIVEKHGGRFPNQFEDVLALPGIGRYTAGALCSIVFNQPTPVLDGNVIRVLTRVFGIRGNPRRKATNAKLWRLAEELVLQAARAKTSGLSPNAGHPLTLILSPTKGEEVRAGSHENSAAAAPFSSPLCKRGEDQGEGFRARLLCAEDCSMLNQALMELGATICTPRQPKCTLCPVRNYCTALRDNSVATLPHLGQRAPATARRFLAFVVEKHNRFLVSQRLAGVVNACLWEFPNIEAAANGPDLMKLARRLLHATPAKLERLCVLKHSITRYRITLEVYRAEFSRRPARAGPRHRWLPLVKLQKLPFASAHRKILNQL